MPNPTSKNQNVSFRRIHGRIVPIKLNRNKDNLSVPKAAASAVAGAALVLGGAYVAAKFATKAKFMANLAGAFGRGASRADWLGRSAARDIKIIKAGKALKISHTTKKISNTILASSAAAGVGLMNKGLSDSKLSTTKRETLRFASNVAIPTAGLYIFNKSFLRGAFPFIK